MCTLSTVHACRVPSLRDMELKHEVKLRADGLELVLTQRERAGLDTIINTTIGPPTRSCVHPKYVSMSVLYGCDWWPRLSARVAARDNPESQSEHVVTSTNSLLGAEMPFFRAASLVVVSRARTKPRQVMARLACRCKLLPSLKPSRHRKYAGDRRRL